ncbi:hypothetical protein HO173_003239 [Letharia columbiana]|uniref:Retrotransposon gag domain-containing protein n=1 Tax=Letharia columbiana TaxID=112416 RepID=A0A8H6G1D8_9LECA|nr:uncharacterized protein HO173_003239 [Letharia columbiana]KAF6238733.1 hypothetical protein HO173_003239 [Letharia columbiana]
MCWQEVVLKLRHGHWAQITRAQITSPHHCTTPCYSRAKISWHGSALHTINFVVEEKYKEAAKASMVKRLVFRARLKDDAMSWYQRLDAATRGDWVSLSKAFEIEYKLEAKAEQDPNKYFNVLSNLKQGRKPIAQYVAEAEHLYRKCPEPLKDYMGNQFVAGIADDSKLDMVQLYLASETKITFPLAKAAVIKAYSRIGRASPFDVERTVASSSKPDVSQGEVNAELLEFFRSLRATQKQQPVVNQYVQPLPPPPQQLGGYRKPAQQDQGGYRSYPRSGISDVISHNCLAPGHFFTNCPEPQVNFKQKGINRAKVEEMNAPSKAPPLPQQAPAAAVAQRFQEHLSQRAEGPLHEFSVAATASRPKVRFEDVDDDKENQAYHDGVAASANRVQKQPAKADRQQPRRAARKVAERVMSGPPELRGQFNRVEDVTDEVEVEDRQAPEATPSTLVDDQAGPVSRMKLPLPPAMRPQPTVEEVQDQQLPHQPRVPSRPQNNAQRPPGVRFIDPPMPSLPPSLEPQRKLNRQRAMVETYEAQPLSSSEPQHDGPQETVAINIAKDRERFQVSQFLNAPVTLPIWQLLDRSPQIRAQLARAMASSKPSRRGRKLTTVAALMSAKEDKAPAVKTEAHEEEEVVCLYVMSWVGVTLIKKTLADTGAVAELINPKLVKQDVWAPVNVAGVVAVIRAFILGMGDIYDILLSKRWMRRVRAIEDHGENTLTIRSKDGVKRVVQGTEAESLNVELVDEPSVDEWRTALAEDEITRLADELDGKTAAASKDPTGSCRGEGPFDALLDRGRLKVPAMVPAWSSGKELRQYSMDAAICESKPMSLRTMHGFPTKRRPQLREMSDASQVEVDKWFAESEITIGAVADTLERKDAAKRLMYT